MKNIIISLLFTCVAISASAICSDRGMWAFPQKSEISQNSLFMLEGYLSSMFIINKLNEDYPVYLQAAGHKVKLEVVSRHEGMFEVAQAILKPVEKLMLGKKYFLKIDNLNKEEKEDLLRWRNGKKEATFWEVTKKEDTQKPSWKQEPRFVESVCTFWGCGPEMYALFEGEINEDSEALIKTKFTNLQTKESRVYYLRIKENKIEVGHGMCSGAFTFDEDKNKKFEVSFALLDASGNESGYSSAIEFKNPFKELGIDLQEEEIEGIEKMSDIQGIYMHSKGKEFWTFYFDKEKEKFVAKLYVFENELLKCEETYFIEKTAKNKAEGFYNVQMEDVSGELVPSWTLSYNKKNNCYDLIFYTYNVEDDKWINIEYQGVIDNNE